MHRIYIHPLPVRIWHWTNAVSCVMLFLTGVQIRYVGLIDVVPFRIAVVVHNWIGFVLIANFFVWLGFYLFSDKIKVYHPELNLVKFFRGSMRQAIYYGYGIFKGAPNPFHVSMYRKFNPLQAMTYQIIMLLLLPIQCFTGILLWNLTRFAGVAAFLGGVRVIDTVHVLIFIVFAFYIPFHAYLGTLGHTALDHYKAMVTGYEELEEGEGADGAD
jgi:thiosulfate reductase cytochrome b subunit